jgi:hypothetical protein
MTINGQILSCEGPTGRQNESEFTLLGVTKPGDGTSRLCEGTVSDKAKASGATSLITAESARG